MGELGEYAKKGSKFIKLGEGESVTGVFQGYEVGEYMGNVSIKYTINDQILSSGSKRLASRMDNVKVGSEIKIIRYGKGIETNYEVEMVKGGKPDVPQDLIDIVKGTKIGKDLGTPQGWE